MLSFRFLCFSFLALGGDAFVISPTSGGGIMCSDKPVSSPSVASFHQHLSSSNNNKATCLSAVSFEDLSDIGYSVSVSKPLGVVFGENEAPFSGLGVDDVEFGQNGGAAGIRVGDQLVAVNGQPVVGKDFDSVMSILVAASGALELQLYRGNIKSLYVILDNKGSALGEQEEDEEEEVIIMDENYESPVQIDVSQYDDKGLTIGDFFKAAKKVGEMLTEGDDQPSPAPSGEEKKGGLFGMFGGETIQLEGEEASSLKGQSRKK